MCRQLLAEGTQALHFYTMNLSLSVRKILRALGMIPPKRDRAVPWKVQNRIRGGSDEVRPASPWELLVAPATYCGCAQQVRPIFWNNRAASYLARTSAWDEFPNGRWGDNRSAAYGSLSGACERASDPCLPACERKPLTRLVRLPRPQITT